MLEFPSNDSVSSALCLFERAVDRAALHPALKYFDRLVSYRELGAISDGLAAWFLEAGVKPGDRVAIVLQNVPEFAAAVAAAWKVGAIATPVNPMNRERELAAIFSDCSPRVIICHPSNQPIVAQVIAGCSALLDTRLLVASPNSMQTRNDRRVLGEEVSRNCEDFKDVVSASTGTKVLSPPVALSDIAILLYTSGTTGMPKGVMLTHANVAFSARVYRDWMNIRHRGVILAMAPMFHVTGLLAHLITCWLIEGTLVLTYRFEPNVMLEAIRESRPQFTVGAITAYRALMSARGATPEDFASFESLYSGGAAIPPAIVEEFERRFGQYINSGYGLSESTAPAIMVPRTHRAIIDANSGVLSIGVPVFQTQARIVDDHGDPLPAGDRGELLLRGPQVFAGYWSKPDDTAVTLQEGWLHTGDIAFVDQDGWYFLVDRKKDMINAGGYKVWPREIEDVLYTHPAILEAAVVGVPDAYRGETVKAVVSLRERGAASPSELIAFCKERMAAYKYPRIIEILEELPKNPAGKILRRELR
jgi:long-chain acyl-CoA synthetase